MAEAFTARRCQILLASADSQAPSAIARALRCTSPTVRTAIHAFAREGLDCLREKSSRPHSAQPLLGPSLTEPHKEVLHQRPRSFGKPTSLWTLDLVAEVCHAKGCTPRVVAGETIRQALRRLGIGWR